MPNYEFKVAAPGVILIRHHGNHVGFMTSVRTTKCFEKRYCAISIAVGYESLNNINHAPYQVVKDKVIENLELFDAKNPVATV